jgi:hypothetical protein
MPRTHLAPLFGLSLLACDPSGEAGSVEDAGDLPTHQDAATHDAATQDAAPGCSADEQCDDGMRCTQDACAAGVCAHTTLATELCTESDTVMITPAGGQRLQLGHVSLNVPPNAVTVPTEIRVRQVDPAALPGLPAGVAPVGMAFAIEPFGTTFAQPVELKVPFAGSDGKLRTVRLNDQGDTSWKALDFHVQDGAAVAQTDQLGLFMVSSEPCGTLDKLDLLFVIDNSGSMAQEQAKLADQLPQLVRILTTGQRGDGSTFTPVRDLHLGIVTSDMGLSGSNIALTSCEGFGDDGKLLKANELAACAGDAPAGYLSYAPNDTGAQLEATINTFACLASVGTMGCGFEQQLEAMYKAVAPSTVQFGSNTGGHGGGANAGFLRPDAVLAVVHVSDENDCSVTPKGEALFDENTDEPGARLEGSSQNLGLNIRCSYGKENERQSQAEAFGLVHPVDRYFKDFKTNVKPFDPDRIVFSAIVGIPDGTSGATPQGLDAILAHPDMAFRVDPNTGNPQGDPTNRNTSSLAACLRTDDNGMVITDAKPAVRFVKVARGFGDNGVVQSICADSFAPAVDKIIDKVSVRLGSTCPGTQP